MSRFGFVTPNDPPRASPDPKTTQKPAGRPPRTQKNARKIAKAAEPIFQNWKDRSRIKRIPNKLGYKREAAERRSNPFDSESLPSSASQEIALRSLLIFRYRWATQKSQQGVILKFLGSRHTQKSALSLQHSRMSFRCWATAFRNSRNRFRVIKIRRQYIRREIP
jgi:hypothetical protein